MRRGSAGLLGRRGAGILTQYRFDHVGGVPDIGLGTEQRSDLVWTEHADDLIVCGERLGKRAAFVDRGSRRRRDVLSFDFPLFCNAFTALPATGFTLIGTDLNVPISCGKVLVRPGDFVLGDAAGVVVLPRDGAEEILRKAVADEELNVFLQKLIREEDLNPGEVYPPPPAIIERFAREKGVPVEELT